MGTFLHLLSVAKKINWASNFLNSEAWNLIQHEENDMDTLKFSLLLESPDVEVSCTKALPAPNTPEQSNTVQQLHSSTTVLLQQKRKDRQIALVDSDLRRSMRIKAQNTGFKPAGCGRKSCLGSGLDPPPLDKGYQKPGRKVLQNGT
jgi:hypothetical protein